MRYQKRADGIGVEIDQSRQRHELSGQRRLDVNLVERIRIFLQLGKDFEHYEIGAHLREILRDVVLAEGVVQRRVDLLRLNAETRRRVAIDGHGKQRRIGLLIGRDVGKLRQRFELGEHFGAQVLSSSKLGSCNVY